MEDLILMKPMSSLEKCFLDENINDKEEMRKFTLLRGQPLCYQVGVSPSVSFVVELGAPKHL